ncbi:MAG: 6-pyruvoyl-tetrahydropterin synthase-related protein [Acidobacteriota bacterium]
MKSAFLSGRFFSSTSFGRKPGSVSAKSSRQDLRFSLLVAAISIAVLLPIVFLGIPNGADLPNHLRFAQPFLDAIQSGHWHPGWLAESNDGFGDPRFRFYPPGFYYLLSLMRMVSGSWYSATILSALVISVIGGLGAYFWARSFCSPKLAFWAGVLFTIAPYHLNELYQASLLSEYAGCSILPFAFAFVERVCRRRRLVDAVGLAAAFALLILTHLPLAVIGSISLTIYALLRIERKHFAATLTRLAGGVVLGLAASAFFWTTVVTELSWIKGSATDPNPYYDYRLNFLFSPAALVNRNTWYANILALAAIGFLLPGIVLIRHWFKDQRHRRLGPALILSVLTFFMATQLSKPIWVLIPKLWEVQFPWRWLSIPSLAGSLLVAASLPKWKEIFRGKFSPRDLAVGAAFVFSLAFIVTQIVIDCEYLNRTRYTTLARETRGAVSFKDWLPVTARDLLHVDLKKGKVDAGERSVALQAWEPERRQFHVAPGSTTKARVRTYYYPHWKATADGQPLPTRAAEDGAVLISIPANAVNVTLEFQEPARVRISEFISLFGWLLIAGFFIANRLAKKFRRPAVKLDPQKLLLANSQ